MANVGLKNFLYAPLGTDETTYTAEASKLAGAIEVKVSIDQNDATLYADDELEYQDNSFVKGTITLGIDDDDDIIFAPLLGKAVTESSITVGSSSEATTYKEVVSADTDIPIYVGFGYITGKQSGPSRKYKAKFYPKIQFKDYETDSKTKEEKLEFTTPSVEGTIYKVDGVWKKEATFDTAEGALAYLKACFVQA